MLWEANFHRPNYDLVPLGEYIYLGGNIRLRTAIKTAGILLPVFLSCQIQCWWQERHFFPFPNFPLPTLAFQWWPSACAAPLAAVVEMWDENCCVFCPGAVGIAGDGAAGVCPAPALHFGWKLIFFEKCLTTVSVTWLSKISGVKEDFFPCSEKGGLHTTLCSLPQLCPSCPLLDEGVLSHYGDTTQC